MLAEQTIRDERDRTRAHSPLMPADGAVVIDTTAMTLPEVVEEIAALARHGLWDFTAAHALGRGFAPSDAAPPASAG